MLDDHLENFEEHLQVLHGLKPKSVAAYVRLIREFFAWCDVSQLGKIRRGHIEAYMKYLFMERGNSNQTRRTKLLALSKFWRFLKYEGVVPRDITEDIPRPIIKNKMIQDFNRVEVLQMFRVPDVYSEKGVRDISMLICLAFAGLRAGELTELTLADIHDDGEYIELLLHDKIVKLGSFRRVDLWKAPSLFLRQWMSIRITTHKVGKGAPLFCSYRRGGKVKGNQLSIRDVDRFVKGMGEAAGLKKANCHAHMFRATHGADLRHIEGMDIAAIAARLGHKNIATTDKYIPKRSRITKRYRSLRDYWREFETLWG